MTKPKRPTSTPIKELKSRLNKGESFEDIADDLNARIADELEQHIAKLRQEETGTRHIHRFMHIDSKGNKVCKECGSLLCEHSNYSSTMCMLDRNHEGPHYNPNALDNLTWSDDEGSYIRSQADWSNLIEQLGKHRH